MPSDVTAKRKRIIKTGPGKATVSNGAAVPPKQIIKTGPRIVVVSSNVTAKHKQIIKTGLEKAIVSSGVTAKGKQINISFQAKRQPNKRFLRNWQVFGQFLRWGNARRGQGMFLRN